MTQNLEPRRGSWGADSQAGYLIQLFCMTRILLLRICKKLHPWLSPKLLSDPAPVTETVFFAWRRLVEARRQVATSGLLRVFHML